MGYQKLQAQRAITIVPSDTDNIPYIGNSTNEESCVLYVGTGGNLRVLTDGNDDVTFLNVRGGSFLPVQIVRVFATGTDADNIIALW